MRSVDGEVGGRGQKAELVWQFVVQLSVPYNRCLFISTFYYALLSTRLQLSSESPNIDPAQLTQNFKTQNQSRVLRNRTPSPPQG